MDVPAHSGRQRPQSQASTAYRLLLLSSLCTQSFTHCRSAGLIAPSEGGILGPHSPPSSRLNKTPLGGVVVATSGSPGHVVSPDAEGFPNNAPLGSVTKSSPDVLGTP